MWCDLQASVIRNRAPHARRTSGEATRNAQGRVPPARELRHIHYDARLVSNIHASRFACTFADKAFSVRGIDASLGLRIRWRGGWLADQVSFVVGSRRYVVDVRAHDGTPDRKLMERLAYALEASAPSHA